MGFAYLGLAVLFEVAGTLLLPQTQQFTRVLPSLALLGLYAGAFYWMSLALRTLPLALVYASWAGLGVFLVALFGWLLYGQAMEWRAILGLMLIASGVVLVAVYGRLS